MNKRFSVLLILCCVFCVAEAQRGFPAKKVMNMSYTTNYPQHVDFAPSMVSQLKVPAGWKVKVAASGLGKPRMLAMAPNGGIYITRRDAADVLLLKDTNGDHVYDEETTIVSDFKGVHGIAINNGWLYLVSNRDLKRFPMNMDGSVGEAEVIYKDPPDAGQHPNRTMHFGPDGKLYLSIGSTCNDCAENNKENATMVRIDTSNWERTIFARGLRNTIGFDWSPVGGGLYGVDNGADTKGDDVPPEELNLIQENKHYGFPYGYGKNVVDETREDPVGSTKEAFLKTAEPDVMEFTSHSAPIAFQFLDDGKALPADWQDDALVCWHGSWGRSKPSGYKVEHIIFENGKPVRSEDFLSGFLNTTTRTRFGRPAGLALGADGAVYISDDENGVLYVVEKVSQ